MEHGPRHQMSVNGKVDGFTVGDLEAVAQRFGLSRKAKGIIEEIGASVKCWEKLSNEHNLSSRMMEIKELVTGHIRVTLSSYPLTCVVIFTILRFFDEKDLDVSWASPWDSLQHLG